MTRDYRRGSPTQSVSRRKQGGSCVWWFLLGGMLGAFAASMYWVQRPEPSSTAPASQPARTGAAAPAVQKPPEFVFPRILTDPEESIEGGDSAVQPPPPPAPRPQPAATATAPAADSGTTTAAPATPPPASPAATQKYMVQAGAFTRSSDAESLRAELAMLGVSSQVRAARLPSGETFYRVQAGPYAGKDSAARVQSLLKGHGKDAMLITVK